MQLGLSAAGHASLLKHGLQAAIQFLYRPVLLPQSSFTTSQRPFLVRSALLVPGSRLPL